MKCIKAIVASISLSLAAYPVNSQDLADLQSSELIAEISYLNGFLQPLNLTSPDRRAFQVAFIQAAVCASMEFDDFREFSIRFDGMLEPYSDGRILPSITARTYNSTVEDGCEDQTGAAETIANLMTTFGQQLTVLAQIERRNQIPNERIFSGEGTTPLNGFPDILAQSMVD